MALIELQDDSFVEELWFVAFDDMDLLAVIYRHGAGPWLGMHRFRYYTDHRNDVFDSDDEKSAYDVTMPDASESSRKKLSDLYTRIASDGEAMDGKVWHVIVRGDSAAALNAFQALPWTHLRHVSSDGS